MTKLAEAGGIFVVLTFVHFVVDWLFQSHDEAMRKSHEWRIRARHCAVYALSFLPVLWWVDLSDWRLFAALNVLFWSHFIEDTYVPVMLWLKYMRQPPQFTLGWESDEKKFWAFLEESPIGYILMIAVDQIVHLTFLWPVVWLIVSR